MCLPHVASTNTCSKHERLSTGTAENHGDSSHRGLCCECVVNAFPCPSTVALYEAEQIHRDTECWHQGARQTDGGETCRGVSDGHA